MLTVPTGVHRGSAMPFGRAIAGSAWSAEPLIKWGTCSVDFAACMDAHGRRGWGYLERNVPV